MTNTHFYHSVYFWLRPDSEADDARLTADGCRTHLSGIPGIVQMNVGVPAGTPGDMVDNSYGVVLLIEFESKEASELYDAHPDHQRFLAELHHLWSRVQVYDAVPG